MDMRVVNNLLAEIDEGNTLLVDPTDGTFNVWTMNEFGKTSMAPYEDVTLATIAEVRARHPASVVIRG